MFVFPKGRCRCAANQAIVTIQVIAVVHFARPRERGHNVSFWRISAETLATANPYRTGIFDQIN